MVLNAKVLHVYYTITVFLLDMCSDLLCSAMMTGV